MGFQATISINLLSGIASGLEQRITKARKATAELMVADWQRGVYEAEKGEDKPDAPDYDETIAANEDGPETTVIAPAPEITWAIDNEFGTPFVAGTHAAAQAAAAHEQDFYDLTAAAVTGG